MVYKSDLKILEGRLLLTFELGEAASVTGDAEQRPAPAFALLCKEAVAGALSLATEQIKIHRVEPQGKSAEVEFEIAFADEARIDFYSLSTELTPNRLNSYFTPVQASVVKVTFPLDAEASSTQVTTTAAQADAATPSNFNFFNKQ